jgi:hypothetical protein
MKTIDKAAVIAAIMDWPGRYQMEDGTEFLGMPASQVPSQLIKSRWKNVSRLDHIDFKDMGLEVVMARYIGGVRPKKFCLVVVAQRYPNQAIHDHLIALGYRHVFQPADWEVGGDAESGPMIHGHPEWHEYCDDDEYIMVNEDGQVVHREERDLELEKWLLEQQVDIDMADQSRADHRNDRD